MPVYTMKSAKATRLKDGNPKLKEAYNRLKRVNVSFKNTEILLGKVVGHNNQGLIVLLPKGNTKGFRGTRLDDTDFVIGNFGFENRYYMYAEINEVIKCFK